MVAHDERKYAAKTSNDILNGAEGLCGENKSKSDSKTSDNGSMENNYRYENKKKFHDEEESAMETKDSKLEIKINDGEKKSDDKVIKNSWLVD